MTHPAELGPNVQLLSRISSGGELELSLGETPAPAPEPDEIVVRVEAAPINPSDMFVLFGAADLSTLSEAGSSERRLTKARVGPAGLAMAAARLDKAVPTGSEGAGTVVATGDSSEARALLGKTVALLSDGRVYARYILVKAAECLVLPDGATAEQGASAYVNPLTVLGMVETMRREGHTAIVHTAAASNVGQMLLRVCSNDGIGLVNIVRSQEQANLMRSLGARHVCDSSAPTFRTDLIAALAETGATLAYDAIGGGHLASEIFFCMEQVAIQNAKGFVRYGSAVHKQVYIYGGLDIAPTIITRNFGAAWSLGAWLMTNFLNRSDPETLQRIRKRINDELTTTFASHYTRRISLAEAIRPEVIAAYSRRATGEKFLICPQM